VNVNAPLLPTGRLFPLLSWSTTVSLAASPVSVPLTL